MSLPDLEARLVTALRPHTARRELLERTVARFAAQLDDVDLLDGVVAAAEGEHISTADFLSRVPGLSRRQLYHWTGLGYLDGVRPGGPGSGHPLVFTPYALAVAQRMTRLVAAGVTPSTANRLAQEILARGRADLAGFQVTTLADVAS